MTAAHTARIMPPTEQVWQNKWQSNSARSAADTSPGLRASDAVCPLLPSLQPMPLVPICFQLPHSIGCMQFALR